MPPINYYECGQCGFSFPSGWGGFLFVENDQGKRIVCPHPGESGVIARVLGKGFLTRLIKGRTVKKRVGYASYCLCPDCLHQFNADLSDEGGKLSWRNYYEKMFGMVGGKDKRECPKCKSSEIKTLSELINQICPKCRNGRIREIKTGIKC